MKDRRLNLLTRYLATFLFLFAALGPALVLAKGPVLPSGLAPLDTSAPAASPAPDAPPQDLKARREDVAERLSVAQRTLDSVPGAAEDTRSTDHLSREVELLKQLDVVYAQLESAEEARKQLEVSKAELEQQLADLRRDGPNEKRPYSFLLLDRVRGTLSTEQSRLTTITAAVTAATEALERAKATDATEQAERRRAKEAVEANSDPAKVAALSTDLRLMELDASVSQESVRLRHAELANAKAVQQICQTRLTLLQETLACLEKEAVFTSSDLHEQLVTIQKQEAALKQDLDAAQVTLHYFERHWSDVRERLDSTTPVTPALREEEQASKLARTFQMRRITLLEKQLERLGPLREAWRRRFALATGEVSRADLMDWKQETTATLEQLDLRFDDLLIGDIRKELADLEQRLQAAKDEDPALAGWIEKERSLCQQFIDARSANLVKLEDDRNVYDNLVREITNKTDQASLADMLVMASQGAIAVWNYELTNFDDSSVTVGKVCGGVVLVVFGVAISRRLTKSFVRRVLSRVGVRDGAAAAFESLAFYVLVVTSVMTALHMVNVPLTVFTFMGGAVAIGVGFGSQNILNNFISGVILLVESPVRVGDIVELGSLSGCVERIGTRSTRIRTGSNTEIIVPNSSFLENNVVNWTLSDSTVRSSIRVGLAYGSPTRDAARWLKHAADEHGLVLKKPEPFVLFADFGENALEFELYFWIGIRTLGDRKRIESDLRFMIDQYFREAGIVIAFPQREMHLNSMKPLEVCVLPQERPASLEAKPGSRAA